MTHLFEQANCAASEDCQKPVKAKGLCEMHYRRQLRNGDPLVRRGPRTDTSEARFWAKVNKTETCWLWTGAKTDGYGMIRIAGASVLCHVWAWERANGPVPEGLLLDHKCGNRACVNPTDLRLVTPKQNKEHLTVLYKNNTSGVQGVSWDATKNRWRAYVNHYGRRHYVGRFADLADAEAAVIARRNELFTHNDRDRR